MEQPSMVHDTSVTPLSGRATVVSEATSSGVSWAADEARRAGAKSLLWTFVALLMGAFCASVAATVGGRQRDHVLSN